MNPWDDILLFLKNDYGYCVSGHNIYIREMKAQNYANNAELIKIDPERIQSLRVRPLLKIGTESSSVYTATIGDASVVLKKIPSLSDAKKEAALQHKAAIHGIAPMIFRVNKSGICMEHIQPGTTLYAVLQKNKGNLSEHTQRNLIRLFKKLDRCGVAHNDPNPLNFVYKGKKLIAIDFGMAQLVNPADKKNEQQMTLGLALMIRQIFPSSLVPRVLIESLPASFQTIYKTATEEQAAASVGQLRRSRKRGLLPPK